MIAFKKEFYFLTVQAETVEVSALEIQNDGGAGFMLPKNRMALAVYFTKSDAEKVFAKNKDRYEKLSLVCLSCEELYFSGERKEEWESVINALNTLYEHILLLNELIVRVENGQTQEASKRILNEIEGNFLYLEKSYKNFSALSKLYGNSAEKLREQTENFVFAKNLRYVVCGLCKGYLDFAGEYSV